MFRWYASSQACYVYLADVTKGKSSIKFEEEFRSSKWFTRGWTLQELLAPQNLRFYDSDWNDLGTKKDMEEGVLAATGIPWYVLSRDTPLDGMSIAQRMSWAARRTTKKEEDMTYCLLGIFGVSMTLNYGEGSERAFRRLQETIMNETKDDSILAWGLEPQFHDQLLDSQGYTNMPAQELEVTQVYTEEMPEHLSSLAKHNRRVPDGILAPSPLAFRHCGRIRSADSNAPSTLISANDLGGVLQLRMPLIDGPAGGKFGILQCYVDGSSNQELVAIPLCQTSAKSSDQFFRPQAHPSIVLPKQEVAGEHVTFSVPKACRKNLFNEDQFHPPYRLRIRGALELGLTLEAVEPSLSWDGETELLTPYKNIKGQGKISSRTIAQFVRTENKSSGFIVVLELNNPDFFQEQPISSQHQLAGYLLTCVPPISLSRLAGALQSGKLPQLGSFATDGSLRMELEVEPDIKQRTFTINLIPSESIHPHVDGSLELRRIKQAHEAGEAFEEYADLKTRAKKVEFSSNEVNILLNTAKDAVERLDIEIQKLVKEREKAFNDCNENLPEASRLEAEKNSLAQLIQTKQQDSRGKLLDTINIDPTPAQSEPLQNGLQRALSLFLSHKHWRASLALLNEFEFSVEFDFEYNGGLYSPLTYAGGYGDEDILQKLLTVADRNREDPDGYTASQRAYLTGNSITEALLKVKKKRREKTLPKSTSDPDEWFIPKAKLKKKATPLSIEAW
ncbi:hypothetical protein MMC25_001301 [Agyrium rufum]|nr:hypothetical protein [Agyrium rufum]